jgi:exosome complex exonuclease DIS3/RRP44
VPAFTKPVLLVGRENMNRAVQGDIVVVEVFDEKEWKAPADAVVDQECKGVYPNAMSFTAPRKD